jgi:hypothetical protein
MTGLFCFLYIWIFSVFLYSLCQVGVLLVLNGCTSQHQVLLTINFCHAEAEHWTSVDVNLYFSCNAVELLDVVSQVFRKTTTILCQKTKSSTARYLVCALPCGITSRINMCTSSEHSLICWCHIFIFISIKTSWTFYMYILLISTLCIISAGLFNSSNIKSIAILSFFYTVEVNACVCVDAPAINLFYFFLWSAMFQASLMACVVLFLQLFLALNVVCEHFESNSCTF